MGSEQRRSPGCQRRTAALLVGCVGLLGCTRERETAASTSVSVAPATSLPTPTVTGTQPQPSSVPSTVPEPTSASTTATTSPPVTSEDPTATTPSVTTQPPTTTATVPVVTLPVETAQVVSIAATTEPVVALTFDAGSDAGHTGRILDELSAHGIRAAFALTGEWVEANPALARRIVNEGHDVMNHSYDHPSFTGVSSDDVVLTTDERWRQLDRTEDVIRTVTGATSLPYFRPPFGDQDATVARDAGARGYRFVVMWTVDSLGWQGLAPSDVVTRCVARAQPGAIMMFHVGSASTDADALPALIDELTAAGYGFRSLPLLVG